MSSAIYFFNLDQSKTLLSGNGLTNNIFLDWSKSNEFADNNTSRSI